MSFRCYEPQYKPDRSPSKYQSKNKLDALSCADAASFVAELLANYKSDKSEKQNPCGVFMALRIEARRLRKSKQRSAPLTAIRARTQQKRLDRFVRRAVKRCRQARTPRSRGLFHPVPGACAATDTGWGGKKLDQQEGSRVFASDGRPLGES